MGNTIYASFNDPVLAEKAAGALLDFGVRAEDISVVQSNRRFPDARPLNSDLPLAEPATLSTERDVQIYSTEPPFLSPNEASIANEAPATFTGTAPSGALRSEMATSDAYREDDSDHSESQAKYGITTTTGADAEAGAAKGAAWGAGVGVLAALASLVIPGVGLVVGGGALAIALAGVAGSAGAGAIAGGATGFLKDQGVDEHVASEYENAVTGGGGLIAVTVPSGDVTELEAQTILNKYGAANINAYSNRGYLA